MNEHLSMLKLLLTLSFFVLLAHTAEAEQESVTPLFSSSNLHAWAFMTFDDQTIEERVQMIKRLGFKRVGFEGHARLMDKFEPYLLAYQKEDIEIISSYLQIESLEPMKEEHIKLFFEVVKKHGVTPELWVAINKKMIEQYPIEERHEVAKKIIRELAVQAKRHGCRIALYNHGGWIGDPENQLALIEALSMEKKLPPVGMVFNFHHAHPYFDRFERVFPKMVPHLYALNLNGMKRGGPKIITLGKGKEEKRMLDVVYASGYRGPIGLIDHNKKVRSEISLRASLKGLAAIVKSNRFQRIPVVPVRIQSDNFHKGHKKEEQHSSTSTIKTLPGFEMELVYKVPRDTQGTWVSLCMGDKGRLYASAQNGSLYRITPGKKAVVEPLKVGIGHAQGLLYAFNSLYLMVNSPKAKEKEYPTGLYRLRDTTGDEQFDEVKQLFRFPDGTSHGVHSIVPGPDGTSLYLISGNRAGHLPEGITSSRVPEVWSEDLLLPRQWPPDGFDRGVMAPAGWVCRTDGDGSFLELISIGARNPFDMAFNDKGDLFYYDADMERDVGTPWYRPTRVCHVVSGSEYGWRGGNGKWPPYYEDSLPAVVDIGLGSPTGVLSAYQAKFPMKYRDALYILDWSYGRVYALHLNEKGASYGAKVETFVEGEALPLVDGVIHPDGSMYLLAGGRGSESALYRLSYVGKESTVAIPKKITFSATQQLRRDLEQFHRPSEKAIDFAWPHLSSGDRFIRSAARIAIEHQDVSHWKKRALGESNPQALISVMVALARHGKPSDQAALLQALGQLSWTQLNESERLGLLRTYALTFIRMGMPKPKAVENLTAKLGPFVPNESDNVNRELIRLLVYLESPAATGLGIDLMRTAKTQQQQVAIAMMLRNLKQGWSIAYRKQYFQWFETAMTYLGGTNYRGYIKNMKRDALLNTTPRERTILKPLIEAQWPKAKPLPVPKGPGKNWAADELKAIVAKGLRNRNFKRGEKMFAAARCASCHHFDRYSPMGGSGGPNLNGVAKRFSRAFIIDSIVDPSSVLNDQFQHTAIKTRDGEVIVGTVVDERNGTTYVMPSLLVPDALIEIPSDTITDKKPSEQSPMPSGLINALNKNELLDLLAYLFSDANRFSPEFRKSK